MDTSQGQVLINVGGLLVDAMVDSAIWVLVQVKFQEGELAILFLFHGAWFDGWVLLFEVLKEFLVAILTMGP